VKYQDRSLQSYDIASWESELTQVWFSPGKVVRGLNGDGYPTHNSTWDSIANISSMQQLSGCHLTCFNLRRHESCLEIWDPSYIMECRLGNDHCLWCCTARGIYTYRASLLLWAVADVSLGTCNWDSTSICQIWSSGAAHIDQHTVGKVSTTKHWRVQESARPSAFDKVPGVTLYI